MDFNKGCWMNLVFGLILIYLEFYVFHGVAGYILGGLNLGYWICYMVIIYCRKIKPTQKRDKK